MVQNRSAAGGHEHHAGRRIWLIRHGETTGGSSLRLWGATDVPLSELGREQVASLGPFLRHVRFRALVHSPLSRARTSAQVVAGQLGASVPPAFECEEGLREIDFGEIEGQTVAEVQAERPDWHAAWMRGDIEGFPGGEALDGFAARVAGAIDAVLGRHPEGDLCVVAHRGVVKNAVCHLTGLPRLLVRAWPLDLGSATVVVEDGGRFLLDRYNLVAPADPA